METRLVPAVFTRTTSKLATQGKARGGTAAGDAIRQAEKAIESLRGVSLGIIDAQLTEIDRLYGPAGTRRETNDLTELYDRALEIIESASGLPKSGLEDAARAVCEFVSRSQALQVCDWDAVDVHVAALRVLRMEGAKLKGAQRKAILTGLQDVMEKRAGIEAPASDT
jgi:hypothetical protein